MDDTWETQTMEIIGQLESGIAQKRDELAELQHRKRALDSALVAFRLVQRQPASLGLVGRADVEGMTKREIIHLIARQNGGMIKVREVTALMIEWGIADKAKSRGLRQMIRDVLLRHPEFIRIGRGQYHMETEPTP